MTQIYLNSLDVKEFRNFAHLTAKLPSGPGVMLVHGTNGLGKSSLFDGIEWALTGKIDHFSQSAGRTDEAHYLRRWRAKEDQATAITLSFSDGGVVGRTLGVVGTEGVADVASYLRSARWQKSISDLQRYLLLTHFLGQSAMSRMTHRKAEDRWEFLQAPAHSDWATKVAQSLHGHGSSTIAKAYDKRHATFISDATVLEQLLSQEAITFDESRVSRAVDDTAAREASLAILLDNERSLTWLGLPATQATDLSIEDTLSLLQDQTDSVKHEILKRRSALEQAQQLIQTSSSLRSERVSISAALSVAKDALSERQQELKDIKNKVNELLLSVDEARAAEQTSSDRSSHFLILLERNETTLRIQEEISFLGSQLENIEADLNEAFRVFSKESQRKEIAGRLDRELVDATREIDDASEKIEAIQDAIEITQGIEQHQNYSALATAEHEEINELIEVNRVELAQANLDRQACSIELESASLSVEELSSAVSQVAALLSPDACECPVCATHIAKAGELQSRALAAAARLAPTLSRHEEALQNAKERERALKRDGELLYRRLQANMGQRTATAKLQIQLQHALARARFRGLETPSMQELSVYRSELIHQYSVARQRKARKQRWRQHAIFAAVDSSAWAQALEIRNELELKKMGIIRHRSQLHSDVASARERLQVEMGLLQGTMETDPVSLQAAFKAETIRLESAKSARQSAHERHLHMSELWSITNVKFTEQSVRLQELQQRHDSLVSAEASNLEAWSKLSLNGASLNDGDSLIRIQEELLAISAHNQQTRLKLDQLREGRIAWTRNLSHQFVFTQLRKRVDLQYGSRDEVRIKALKLQSELISKANAVQRAKTIARASYGRVSTQIQAFNQEYLQPLSQIMAKFNKAILSDQSLGFELEVAKNKIHQVSRRTISSNGSTEIALDPHLVHSEGQMAALAVSMLCAASLTFPWSRWRGLVLDDPLQHNDVIRSSAFADMVCNLITSQRYQILLSTHDIAQAQFLKRKFAAQNIPMTMVHLLGRDISDSGTQVDISYYNMNTEA